MTLKQCLSAGMIALWVSPLCPMQARADEPSPAGSPGLRASIDRAIVKASNDQTAPATLPANGKRRVARQASNGGGGGHTALILGLVGTAAGLGATYYLVKESQKQTKDLIGEVTPH
jgi:hypothetical protein